MDNLAEYVDLASSRRDMYGFLARMYRREIDEELLERMRTLRFSSAAQDGEFSEGSRLLDDCLVKLGFNARSELAVDYARVFLAAGIADGSAAFPYESVYTSADRLMMQDARDEVLAAYRKKGLGKSGSDNDPEDHIALELEFMAFLVEEGLHAARENDEAALIQSIGEQLEFLRSHLLNWVPRFCSDVKRYAETDFYRAISFMTVGYVSMDENVLEGLCGDGR